MKIGHVEFEGHCDIKAEMCLVTPAKARVLLERNTHNRKIRETVLAKYVAEMLADEWFPSQNGIGFDGNGRIIDGQHRLEAVARSGKTVWLLLVTHLPSAAQEKTDRHAKRSLVDCFTLSGIVTRGPLETSVAVMLARRSKGATTKRNVPVADVDVKDALATHRLGINAVLDALNSVAHTKGMTRAGVMAAFVHGWEKRPKETEEFIRRFVSGEMMTSDQPPFRLRRYMTEQTEMQSGGTFQMLDYERTSYALRAWFEDRTINALRTGYAIDER